MLAPLFTGIEERRKTPNTHPEAVSVPQLDKCWKGGTQGASTRRSVSFTLDSGPDGETVWLSGSGMRKLKLEFDAKSSQEERQLEVRDKGRWDLRTTSLMNTYGR